MQNIPSKIDYLKRCLLPFVALNIFVAVLIMPWSGVWKSPAVAPIISSVEGFAALAIFCAGAVFYFAYKSAQRLQALGKSPAWSMFLFYSAALSVFFASVLIFGSPEALNLPRGFTAVTVLCSIIAAAVVLYCSFASGGNSEEDNVSNLLVDNYVVFSANCLFIALIMSYINGTMMAIFIALAAIAVIMRSEAEGRAEALFVRAED